MDTRRLLECLNRIENNADSIWVRHGKWNRPLSNLPTEVAVKWVCTWIRRNLEPDAPVQSVPVWDIKDTELGRRFERRLEQKP